MLAIKIFLLKNSFSKLKEHKNILPAFLRKYSNCFTKISLKDFHIAFKNIMCYIIIQGSIILLKSINWWNHSR